MVMNNEKWIMIGLAVCILVLMIICIVQTEKCSSLRKQLKKSNDLLSRRGMKIKGYLNLLREHQNKIDAQKAEILKLNNTLGFYLKVLTQIEKTVCTATGKESIDADKLPDEVKALTVGVIRPTTAIPKERLDEIKMISAIRG